MPKERNSPTIEERKETQAKILEHIAAGRSLLSIGRDPSFPNPKTVYRWLADDAEFRSAMEFCMKVRADLIFEEMLEIADSTEEGADVNRDRLRVDTRKWALARLQPKKYGDRIEHANSEENPIQPMINISVVRGTNAASEVLTDQRRDKPTQETE